MSQARIRFILSSPKLVLETSSDLAISILKTINLLPLFAIQIWDFRVPLEKRLDDLSPTEQNHYWPRLLLKQQCIFQSSFCSFCVGDGPKPRSPCSFHMGSNRMAHLTTEGSGQSWRRCSLVIVYLIHGEMVKHGAENRETEEGGRRDALSH